MCRRKTELQLRTDKICNERWIAGMTLSSIAAFIGFYCRSSHARKIRLYKDPTYAIPKYKATPTKCKKTVQICFKIQTQTHYLSTMLSADNVEKVIRSCDHQCNFALQIQ